MFDGDQIPRRCIHIPIHSRVLSSCGHSRDATRFVEGKPSSSEKWSRHETFEVNWTDGRVSPCGRSRFRTRIKARQRSAAEVLQLEIRLSTHLRLLSPPCSSECLTSSLSPALLPSSLLPRTTKVCLYLCPPTTDETTLTLTPIFSRCLQWL